MAFNYESVFNDSVAILNAYNFDYSPDFQVEQFYNECEKEIDDTVLAIINGCFENRNALDVLLDGFYEKDGKSVLRSERNSYKFVAYLVLFCFNDIGAHNLKNFIKCVEPQRLHRFLKCITDETNLRGWMRNGWINYYDESFVDSKLLNPIISVLPELHVILKQLKKSIDGKTKPKVSKPATRPYSFDLSEIQSKRILIPTALKETIKANPVPKSLYQTPKELEDLKKTSLTNKDRANQLLLSSKISQPRCAVSSKDVTRNADDGDDDSSNKKLNFKAKQPPKSNANSIPVKLNAATVLKQGHLYKKETEEVFKQLEDLEKGAYDAREFINWQTEMKQSDYEKQLIEIEKRRLQGKLSYEEAILAREQLADENKRRALNIKKEKEILKETALNTKAVEEQRMKEIVDKVTKDRENNKVIQADLQMQKKKLVKEMNEESEELLQEAIRKAEIEMQQKMELIQQIKAIESIPVIKASFVDLTSTAGHALLSEMSMAELRERLQFLKNKQLREIEEKHDEIITNKLTKDKVLVDTLEFINSYKNMKMENSKNNEKVTYPNDASIKNNTDVVNLNNKILSMKKARQNQQNSNKVTNQQTENKNQKLHLNYLQLRKEFEINRIKDLENTQERIARQSYKV